MRLTKATLANNLWKIAEIRRKNKPAKQIQTKQNQIKRKMTSYIFGIDQIGR